MLSLTRKRRRVHWWWLSARYYTPRCAQKPWLRLLFSDSTVYQVPTNDALLTHGDPRLSCPVNRVHQTRKSKSITTATSSITSSHPTRRHRHPCYIYQKRHICSTAAAHTSPPQPRGRIFTSICNIYRSRITANARTNRLVTTSTLRVEAKQLPRQNCVYLFENYCVWLDATASPRSPCYDSTP